MPVIIRNLIVNAEVGKAEVKERTARSERNGTDVNKQRIMKLEEMTDQLLQILRDQNER